MTDTLAPRYQKAITAMRPAIEALYRHYEGFSTHWVEKEELPAAELEAFLERLDINYPDASHMRIKLAIWACIQRLSCFRYRVIHPAADGHVSVWNPLEIPLKTWRQQHPGGELHYRDTDQPYPATDLIADWVARQLHEPLAQDG